MLVLIRRTGSAAALAWLLLFASGCPNLSGGPAPSELQPQPTATPRLVQARVNPIFRLVVPPRPRDAPARLVLMFVRLENLHDRVLAIGPDRIQLELPDGTSRPALDKPRAVEILRRSLLARYDLRYLKDQPPPPSGGLSHRQIQYWSQQVERELLDETRLAPGDTVEGFVVVDTGRRFRSLRNSVVEAVADSADGGESEQVPVRIRLGLPIRVGP